MADWAGTYKHEFDSFSEDYNLHGASQGSFDHPSVTRDELFNIVHARAAAAEAGPSTRPPSHLGSGPSRPHMSGSLYSHAPLGNQSENRSRSRNEKHGAMTLSASASGSGSTHPGPANGKGIKRDAFSSRKHPIRSEHDAELDELDVNHINTGVDEYDDGDGGHAGQDANGRQSRMVPTEYSISSGLDDVQMDMISQLFHSDDNDHPKNIHHHHPYPNTNQGHHGGKRSTQMTPRMSATFSAPYSSHQTPSTHSSYGNQQRRGHSHPRNAYGQDPFGRAEEDYRSGYDSHHYSSPGLPPSGSWSSASQRQNQRQYRQAPPPRPPQSRQPQYRQGGRSHGSLDDPNDDATSATSKRTSKNMLEAKSTPKMTPVFPRRPMPPLKSAMTASLIPTTTAMNDPYALARHKRSVSIDEGARQHPLPPPPRSGNPTKIPTPGSRSNTQTKKSVGIQSSQPHKPSNHSHHPRAHQQHLIPPADSGGLASMESRGGGDGSASTTFPLTPVKVRSALKQPRRPMEDGPSPEQRRISLEGFPHTGDEGSSTQQKNKRKIGRHIQLPTDLLDSAETRAAGAATSRGKSEEALKRAPPKSSMQSTSRGTAVISAHVPGDKAEWESAHEDSATSESESADSLEEQEASEDDHTEEGEEEEEKEESEDDSDKEAPQAGVSRGVATKVNGHHGRREDKHGAEGILDAEEPLQRPQRGTSATGTTELETTRTKKRGKEKPLSSKHAASTTALVLTETTKAPKTASAPARFTRIGGGGGNGAKMSTQSLKNTAVLTPQDDQNERIRKTVLELKGLLRRLGMMPLSPSLDSALEDLDAAQVEQGGLCELMMLLQRLGKRYEDQQEVIHDLTTKIVAQQMDSDQEPDYEKDNELERLRDQVRTTELRARTAEADLEVVKAELQKKSALESTNTASAATYVATLTPTREVSDKEIQATGTWDHLGDQGPGSVKAQPRANGTATAVSENKAPKDSLGTGAGSMLYEELSQAFEELEVDYGVLHQELETLQTYSTGEKAKAQKYRAILQGVADQLGVAHYQEILPGLNLVNIAIENLPEKDWFIEQVLCITLGPTELVKPPSSSSSSANNKEKGESTALSKTRIGAGTGTASSRQGSRDTTATGAGEDTVEAATKKKQQQAGKRGPQDFGQTLERLRMWSELVDVMVHHIDEKGDITLCLPR